MATRAGLLPQIAKLQILGANVAFRYFPLADPHDANHYIMWVAQGGLGLPDRDYYFAQGAASDSTRQAFVAHIAKVTGRLNARARNPKLWVRPRPRESRVAKRFTLSSIDGQYRTPVASMTPE